jgi:hypothetical protein
MILRRAWSESKAFRVFLILSIVWFVLRFTFQLVYASGFFPELASEGGLPIDLPVYLGAAEKFLAGQSLYPQDLSDSTYHYPYSPPFAMLSIVLLWLPAQWVAILGTLVSVIAGFLIYIQWLKIFRKFEPPNLERQMTWMIPVWLVYSAFWGEITYLNIGVLVALIATLLVRCVLEERLGWAVLLLTFLCISKIMWAFPVALPFLFGRRRFFFRLIGLTGAAYLVLVGLTMLASSPAYVTQQYGEYFNHLRRLGTEFPWHLWSNTHILGYNHSIKQLVIFLLGVKPWVFTLATGIKLIFLAPLAIIGWRLFRHPTGDTKPASHPTLSLDLVFALYLGAFIWLDIVWEALLGIAIFAYLLATLEHKWKKGFIFGVFLLYALVDVIQLVSYGIGGDAVLELHGQYVLTDPSIYFPLTMVVILLFYTPLMVRLWKTTGKLIPGNAAAYEQ